MTTPHEAVKQVLETEHSYALNGHVTGYAPHTSDEIATAAIEALRKGAVQRVDEMEGRMEAQGRTKFISDYVDAILGPPN
jgi:hypothetical protein